MYISNNRKCARLGTKHYIVIRPSPIEDNNAGMLRTIFRKGKNDYS